MLELPVPPPEFTRATLSVSLEGDVYQFAYTWLPRTRSWYLDVATAAGESIAAGLRIVTHWPLWRSLRDDRLPPGQLVAVSLSDDDSNPGREDLGGRIRLVYLTADEVEELQASASASSPKISKVP